MRKTLLPALLLLLAAAPASAHPGVGIVLDRAGNVFYTDLQHVWRIAPNGAVSVAVRNVHSHELAIDSAGNLYGEDSQYLGGDRYRHRVWRRTANGTIEDVIPWTEGFWRQYGLVRDGAGVTYWSQCPERVCTIRRRDPAGRISTVGPNIKFNNYINWLAAGPHGSLYVVDGEDLRIIARDGSIRTHARSIGSGMMGLWPEGSSLYVAVYGTRSVVRVDSVGNRRTIARTAAPWAPSGIARARNGTLWILEYSTSNEARVRRITTDGSVRTFTAPRR